MFYSIHSQEKKLEKETKNITLCLCIMFTEKIKLSLVYQVCLRDIFHIFF